jgi:hypothetical protein
LIKKAQKKLIDEVIKMDEDIKSADAKFDDLLSERSFS